MPRGQDRKEEEDEKKHLELEIGLNGREKLELDFPGTRRI